MEWIATLVLVAALGVAFAVSFAQTRRDRRDGRGRPRPGDRPR